MTLAHIFATGSGEMAARIVIEGLPIELVSHPDMERIVPLDGRERVYCFDLNEIGLVIDESVNIPEAILEAPGTSIKLFETEDERLAQAFWWEPDQEWFVAQNVEVADSTIQLLSADGIEVGKPVYLGTETMIVTAINGNQISVARGAYQSIRQKHWSGAEFGYRKLTNRPVRVRGRRVYLYLYGDTDSLQANGTQVWIGHVSSEPVCDDSGTSWRIQLTSIAERLKGKLGGDLSEPVEPRGIYYPGTAPLCVSIVEDDRPPDTPLRLVGFFESQDEFLAALNAAMAADPWISSRDHTFRAVATPDGGWTVSITVEAPVMHNIYIGAVSTIDPPMWGVIRPAGPVAHTDMQEIGGGIPPSVEVGQVLLANRNLSEIPAANIRGHYGWPEYDPPWFTGASDWAGTRPERIYARLTADTTAVEIEWPNGHTQSYRVYAINEPEGWFEIMYGATVGGDPPEKGIAYWEGALPRIRPMRSLGEGTIADLRNGLVIEGPEYCNRAGMPFLAPLDLASWQAVVAEAARGRQWLLQRSYSLAQEIELEDLLSHEMRLYGLFPIINADGAIGVQSLQQVIYGGDAVELDEEIVGDIGWSTVHRGNQTVNTVVLRTGYDPREDEWTGRKITVQNMDSYALDHEERPLEIEPRSTAKDGDDTIGYEDASEVIKRVTDVFGFPHAFVTVNVPWTHFNVRLGDAVSFSADHLPDYRTGKRPTTKVRGIVVARRWELGSDHGTLQLLIHGLIVGGYSPTAKVVSVSGGADGPTATWTFTVDPNEYAPANATATSFFREGDAIRILQYDTESPVVRQATVTDVDEAADTITAEMPADALLDAAMPVFQWELVYDTWPNCTDEQRMRFAYIADEGATLDSENPRLYAP